MPNVIDPVVLDPLISTNGWEHEMEDDVDITTTRNRSESRTAPIPYLVKRFTIPFQNLGREQRLYMMRFNEGRVGRLRGFLLWDFENFRATSVTIGVGTGSLAVFQLAALKGDSANSYLKPCTRPVPTNAPVPVQLAGLYGGGFAITTVTVGGAAKTEGTDYSISPTTGRITFAAGSIPPSGAAIVASFLYYTPVRFDGPTLKFDIDGILGTVQGQMVELLERAVS